MKPCGNPSDNANMMDDDQILCDSCRDDLIDDFCRFLRQLCTAEIDQLDALLDGNSVWDILGAYEQEIDDARRDCEPKLIGLEKYND